MLNLEEERRPATHQLSDHIDSAGSGLYLLTECVERESEGGRTRLQLTLEDATGRVRGFVWPECRAAVTLPALPAPVMVAAKVQTFEGSPQLRVRQMMPIAPDQVPCAAMLLPRRQCPEAALPALDRLIRLESELAEPLAGFLRQLLLDPKIGIPFLRCRASVRHHHAYVGGLLVHSTEQLDLAAAATRSALPGDMWSPQLAQLGYLLHDLGKLISVGETRRSEHGLVLRHETITVHLLARHLAWLQERNTDLAVGLSYILEYVATPSSARRMSPYLVAEIVVALDQWSAAAHNGRDLPSLLRPAHAASVHTIHARQPAANDSLDEQEVRHAS